ITDPGQDTVSKWIVHWGDGKTDTFSKGGLQTHVYDDGPMTASITVDLRDDDGLSTNAAAATPIQVTVRNVAPIATLTGGEVNEHTSGLLSFSNQFDPSSADTKAGFKYSYDFGGDGVFEIVDSSSASAVVSADLLDDGDQFYAMAARITDKDGGST